MVKLLQKLKAWPKSSLILALIVLAIGLRFYRLGEIPYGFTWDEAAITYNAWSVSLSGSDEHNTAWPLSFKSFGDYKAPGLVYFLAGLYRLFGLHPMWIRWVSALAGAASIFGAYRLTKSLTAALLLAVSAYAIALSRVGFEANVALALVVWGMYFWLNQKKAWMGAILLAISTYTYHSAKIVVPLLVILSFWFGAKSKKGFFIFGGLVLPLAYDAIFGMGATRAQTLMFSPAGIITNVGLHLSPQFLVLGKDAINLRHLVPGFGIMYWVEALLFMGGFLGAIWRRDKQQIFWVFWWLIGLLPSLLSADAPHALRSAIILPAQVALAAYGFGLLNRIRWGQTVAITLLVIQVLLFSKTYFGAYATESALAFQYGYQEAVETGAKLGKAAQRVYFTDAYEQPYVYILLYRQLKPSDFLSGGLADYTIGPIDWGQRQAKAVYVATPEEIPVNDPRVVKVITVPGSSRVVFVVAKT